MPGGSLHVYCKARAEDECGGWFYICAAKRQHGGPEFNPETILFRQSLIRSHGFRPWPFRVSRSEAMASSRSSRRNMSGARGAANAVACTVPRVTRCVSVEVLFQLGFRGNRAETTMFGAGTHPWNWGHVELRGLGLGCSRSKWAF